MPVSAPGSLIVRLRNWVGDVTLGVPLLRRLEDAGYSLQLVGKGWARSLLAGHGWPVHALPATLSERVALLRRLRREAGAAPAQGPDALCLPWSFSSALEFRLAGLRALGHAHEGRSLLLGRAVRRPIGRHELEVYWQLGNVLLGRDEAPPPSIGLRVAPEHLAQARELRAAHGLDAGTVFICPFAGGTFSKLDKTWPHFAEFASQQLPRLGRRIAVCPGPGEEAQAHAQFGHATVLEAVPLGVYAGLLKEAALMIANDTGPGHIAAAVGAPLISVLGPTDAAQWGAWGPTVQLLQSAGGTWPSVQAVHDAAARVLR